MRCLLNKSTPVLFIIFLVIDNLIKFLSAELMDMLDPSAFESSLAGKSLSFIFFTLVIAAPVLETFIFQYAILELAKKIKLREMLSVLLSAAIFASVHFANALYVLFAFIPGLLFAYGYVLIRRRSGSKAALLFVMLWHSASNFISFLNNHWFN